MIDASRRQEILKQGPLPTLFKGEPLLGSYYTQEEVDVINKTLRESMDWHTGFGFMVKEITDFEEAFAKFCGTEFAMSINGAGTGLDMAMMALDLEPGDEVIVPAINFRAAPMSVVGQGGQVIWCDVDERTFQADPEDVERRITPRTRAIYPVHMNGLSAPMDDYFDIAERHPHPKHGPLKVIGDAARSCGGRYKDTRIGKRGWMTVFSFHTQKLMTTLGEGGGVTTDDPELITKLRGYRQFGSASGGWGTNYKMTKIQAAVGSVQVKHLDEKLEQRRAVAHARTKMLEGVPELTLPYEPADRWHSFYLYTMLVPKDWAGDKRNKLIKIMAEEHNVGCVVANPPVYLSGGLVAENTKGQDLPKANLLGNRLFCMSIHPLITPEQNEYMCAALIDTVERLRKE